MNAVLSKFADNFSETAIDDEIVVMNLSSGDFFSLTGTARAIWLLLDGTRDLAAVTAALAADYGAEPDAIGPEVADFVTELEAAGLIRRG